MALLWAATFVLLARFCILVPRVAVPSNHDVDFAHLWLGGRVVASGHADALYDPATQERVYRAVDPGEERGVAWVPRNATVGAFFYPPPTALAYAPLGRLPLGRAAVVMAVANLALAVVLAWLLARWLEPPIALPAAALAVLLHPAFFASFAIGQNAPATLAAVLLAWGLCARGRDFAAGLTLGLLVLKPTWLVALGWVPLVHGRWRVVAGIAASALAVVGATLAALGPAPFAGYLALLPELARIAELPGYDLRISVGGSSVFVKWLGPGRAADALGVASALALGLATWVATRGCWRPGTASFRRLMACSLAAALWVHPSLFYYDQLAVAALVVAIGREWGSLGRAGQLSALAVAALGYLAIPWDRAWPAWALLPVPSVAALALWAWFAVRTRSGAAAAQGRAASSRA